MPVRFVCPYCQQVLSVTRRKIGQGVECPRCQTTSVVPEKTDGAQQVEQLRARQGGRQPEVIVYDEVERFLPPPPAPRSAPMSVPLGMIPSARRPDPAPRGDVLLVSRRVVYVQALLFCLVAAAAFGGGFYFGRLGREAGDASAASGEAAPIALSGSVSYAPQGGGQRVDAGAVVIALPVDHVPARRFEARGLRPQDERSSLTAAAELAIHDLGGDAVRVDDSGLFQLVVPHSGEYRMLIISAAGKRASARLDPEVLAELAKYFDSPNELLGLCEFRWSRETIQPNPPPLSQTFGEGG